MLLSAGTRLGPYEIVSPLGSGGMGEVYRARDTRLGRDVAVKVLPQHLSENAEVRARFEREARTISSLAHPHICTLFDVGREGDTDYLVMELVEGDTLADRLRRGPLAPAELLRFATQIADALDRAHRAGVIHRDLKPGNIMITRAGAKLMDFGLSRVTGMAGQGSGSGRTLGGLTQSPTVAQALTAEGTLLGTFQYMSPEQLEGREADVRSDIWALGCVLYEMATGRRAFEGRSQASLIAAILEREPAPVSEVPSGSATIGAPPQGLDRLIRHCLAKDPEERFQTAHDVKLQLQGIAEGAGFSISSAGPGSTPGVGAPARTPGVGALVAWIPGALGLLLAAGVFAWLYPRAHAPATMVRFRINVPAGTTDIYWPRLSPDGRSLVMLAQDSGGVQRAWLRPIDQIGAHPIAGTEGVIRPYWSPDGRELAFVAAGKIQRVSAAGGTPTVVCEAQGGADLSWGSKGLILMDGAPTESLRVVPAGGGELRPATRIERADGEIGAAWPCFLPDGEHFLYIATRRMGERGGDIRLGRIGTLDSRLLGRSAGRVEYAPGDWAVFVRGTSLVAQKLDVRGARLVGQPIPIAEGLRVGGSNGHFSVSASGALAVGLSPNVRVALQAVNRAGLPQGRSVADGLVINPALSPDGRQLMYQRALSEDQTDGDISVVDLARGTDTRLTFTNGRASAAQWSPDGRRFACMSATDSATSILIGSADGLGARDSIALPQSGRWEMSQWTADGTRFLASNASHHIVQVPVAGAVRQPEAISDPSLMAWEASLSPDGRWMAVSYGRDPGVFVESRTGTPGRWQISTGVCYFPHWTKAGSELVYETASADLMAVDVDTREGFKAGVPHLLFKLPAQSPGPGLRTWACDDAAERFWVTVPVRSAEQGIMEVVTDFRPLVSRR